MSVKGIRLTSYIKDEPIKFTIHILELSETFSPFLFYSIYAIEMGKITVTFIHIESRRVTFVVLSFIYIVYHTINSFIPCERTKEIVSQVTRSVSQMLFNDQLIRVRK